MSTRARAGLGGSGPARADGMSIAPPRRADRAGASSMILIESDSISVSDAASGKYRRRINHRDRDVDVAPACRGEDIEGAVAVEPDRSQLRLPAPGEQRASRQQNRRGGARLLVPMASASCVAWRPARLSAGTELGQARERTARVRARACAPAACAPVSRARAQRQGRPKAARAACVAAGRAEAYLRVVG